MKIYEQRHYLLLARLLFLFVFYSVINKSSLPFSLSYYAKIINIYKYFGYICCHIDFLWYSGMVFAKPYQTVLNLFSFFYPELTVVKFTDFAGSNKFISILVIKKILAINVFIAQTTISNKTMS